MKDYYKILDLPEGASKDDIKKQYKKLSLKYHPDHNPEGQEKFIAIKEAYDHLIQDEVEINMPFFMQTYTIYITLEEAHKGCNKEVQFTSFFTNNNNNIYGKVVTDIINIPAGTIEGTHIKVNPNNIFVIKYIPHSVFEFRNGRLCYILNIDIPSAVLGGKFKIPTIDSEIEIELPECNQNDDIFRCKGKGIGNTDLYVILKIKMPTNLLDKERKYYKKLKKLND